MSQTKYIYSYLNSILEENLLDFFFVHQRHTHIPTARVSIQKEYRREISAFCPKKIMSEGGKAFTL